MNQSIPPGADHNLRPVTVRCKQCGSEEVIRDASAVWSDSDQTWELAGVNDQGYCDNCGSETSLAQRYLGTDGEDYGAVTQADLYDSEVDAKLQERRIFATTQAALRFWQREAVGVMDEFPEDDIASGDGKMVPLTGEEIDTLCESLNR